jgi:hypothetical protein
MFPLKRSFVRLGARFENSSGCSGSERFRSHRQDRTEARFAAVHLFVGFLDAVERIFLNHRVHAAQRAEFQCVLRIPRGPGIPAGH